MELSNREFKISVIPKTEAVMETADTMQEQTGNANNVETPRNKIKAANWTL